MWVIMPPLGHFFLSKKHRWGNLRYAMQFPTYAEAKAYAEKCHFAPCRYAILNSTKPPLLSAPIL